ncbi:MULTISPECIES: TetR/AcrR family transcriptional regulator [unclassified Streptomyces]|uniref:TetR/AcrR family transcriptional regulator n=1 Tax=unclassified Streptomyces TaxID=2593676 RepID=UPI002E1A14D1|nr:TetR/AcrR family transcriptional regulator [Streptomyces sp. NBC_01023]
MTAEKHTQPQRQKCLWERIDAPAPTPRASLSSRQIADAAVRIADAEGLAAVTMRRLATELGVAPMAAYRYVSGKDELLELMIDRVYAEADLFGDATGWRETLRTVALGTRLLVLAHAWLGQLSSPRAGVALTPARFAVMERALASLDGLGLDADTMHAAFVTVSSFTLGQAYAEVAMRQAMTAEGWSSGDDVRGALAPQMTYLMGTGKYPTYHTVLRTSRRKDDPLWQFETGLDCVLDGIAARMGI